MKSNSRFTKIAVASGIIVASGAAVLGITGFASAEMAQNRSAVHAVAQASDSNDTAASAATDAGTALDPANGAVGAVGAQALDGQAPDHMGGPRFVTDALAKVLGLSTTDLQTQLQTKSLADIAKAQNVDIAKVKDQLLKDFTEKETAEVASGEHTQAEVDQKIKDFTANLDTMVNNVRPAGAPGMGGKGGHMGAPKLAAEAVAKVLGLSTTDLQTQLQTKSLADIAKAQNVDISKVKDAIIAEFKSHLDDEVASGQHTQAEADQKLKDFTANLDTMVNNVRPAGAPGMGGKGGPGMGGHMGAPIALDNVAKVLGLSTTDLQTQLQTKSYADIAKAQNVDIAKVKDQLLKDYTERETAQVASGEHTQAEVDQKIKDFTANLDTMVNTVRPAGAPGMRGMGGPGMGGHMGGHGHGHGDGDGPMGALGGQTGSTMNSGSATQGASFSA